LSPPARSADPAIICASSRGTRMIKSLIPLAFFVFPVSAMAQDCHWSGGEFEGQKANFQARFAVNEACTEMRFQSSGNAGIQAQDEPETFALTRGDHGWLADIHGVEATLAANGNFVNFIGEGVNVRLQVHAME
jgi:hypothetical protein